MGIQMLPFPSDGSEFSEDNGSKDESCHQASGNDAEDFTMKLEKDYASQCSEE
jgi:hypothetical protein